MAQDILFLAGGATPAGWSDNEARSPGAMLKTGDGTWVWYGKLKTGNQDEGAFKLPTTNSGWDNCYHAPEAWYQLYPDVEADLSEDSYGDNKFSVTMEGLYRVTVNTSTMKIRADLLTGSLTQENGYYLIGSLDDYFLFVATISDMNTEGLKARLTADLDFSGSYFYPLSNDRYKFKGEFDGAGHTIKGINVVTKHNSMGFIRWAANGAHIHDLVVEGSIEADSKVGGIIGRLHDGGTVKLTNVVNRIAVTATGSNDANAAAFLSCAEGGTKIEAVNCVSAANISGQSGQCGAFCGWAQQGSSFTNCFNCAAINGIEGSNQLYRGGSSTLTNCYDFTASGSQGTQGDPAKLASGEFCYQLNGDQSTITWHQTIGIDAHPYPVPGHEVVLFASGYYFNTGYNVSLKEGTDDATNWQGKAGEGEYQALPLTGLEAGTAVTVKYNGTKKVKSVKAVKKAPANVPVESITLNKTATEIAVGLTETLSVTEVLPANATDPTYTWKSSDETKATVDQTGKVTAKAAGTVNIYAEANDGSGVKGTCAVTVKNAATTVTWEGSTLNGLDVESGKAYTAGGITLSVGSSSENGAFGASNSIEITCIDASGFTFTAPSGKKFTKIEMTPNDQETIEAFAMTAVTPGIGTGWSSYQEISTTGKVTWTGEASSVDMLNGVDGIQYYVSKIVFTLE